MPFSYNMRVNPSLRLRRRAVYAAGAVPHALAMFGELRRQSSRRYIGGVLVQLNVIPNSLARAGNHFMLVFLTTIAGCRHTLFRGRV
jgi:hypothetical protein